MCKKRPKPKYEIGQHPFGQVLNRHYHDEDFLMNHEWTYQMIKVGKKIPFWYAEEELDAMAEYFKKAAII